MNYTRTLILLLLFESGIAGAQSLENYFEEAASRNPGLNASYLEFEAALEEVEQANSLPEMNISFGYFVSPVETRVGPQRAKFSFSQMFPWFGTLRRQNDASALLAESKYKNFLDQRNFLYFELAKAYYPLYEIEKVLDIQQANLEILHSYKSIAERQFANGNGPMSDVLRIDLLINEAETEMELLKRKRLPYRTAFNRLLNRADTFQIQIPDTLLIRLPETGYRRDSILYEAHPRIESYNLKTEAFAVREEAADRMAMPKFGVGLDYVLVDRRTDLSSMEGNMLEGNGRNALMPMVSMSIPLFNSKYRSVGREAQIMQEAYASRKEAAINDLLTRYDKVWFEMEEGLIRYNLFSDQINEIRQVLNLLFSSYSNEGEDIEELLQVQQELLNYEMRRVAELVKYQVAYAELDYITAKNN